MSLLRAAFLVGICLLFSVRGVLAQSSVQLRAQIDRLETQLNTLERAFYKGKPLSASENQKYTASSSQQADLLLRLTDIEEQQRKLTGKYEELYHQNKQLERQLAALVNQLAEERNNPAPIIDKPPLPTSRKSTTAEEDYNAAYALVEAHQYDAARTAMERFISTYPKHDLISNAYYWAGETHYADGHYHQASIQFLKGYQAAPKGGKAADNLLKLGISLSHMKKNTEACATLLRLGAEFPDAPMALQQRVKTERERLSCP